VRFHKRAALPSILEDVPAWCSHVSSSDKETFFLTLREVSAALKAMLMLSPNDVEALVEASWETWTLGGDLLPISAVHELATSIVEFMPDSNSERTATPVKVSEDDSAKLEDGHTRSGVVCSCGQVHVRRGDRIRRGAAQSAVDESDVSAGQLGTIVRIGDGQESVTVKWDRCPEGKVHCYTWPDPEGLVLAPASFAEVALDVADVQEQTGLSSMAAEELLRQVDFESAEAAAMLRVQRSGKLCEHSLRQPLKVFHRVRLLPDKALVQQWFDTVPACQCNKPSCCGGVQWSSRAEKHLGREGFVLKVDSSDDTVLVETRGPCNCQIWYPRLALEPVYDPDLVDEPEFEVSDRVECRMKNGWEKGTVKEVLWRGAERKGACPYAVKLDNGTDIFVPHANLIRAA